MRMAIGKNPDGAMPRLNRRHVALLWIERVLLVAGVVLLSVYAAARIDGWVSSGAALDEMDRARTGQAADSVAGGAPLPEKEDVDFSLWSRQRIRAFLESLSLTEDRALAVLELDRLRIRVPVFEGTDELALNRGAGWIRGTARPGELGNTGIAGHRDGFFRVLMHVQAGDRIELQMPDKTVVYRVSRTEIVNPRDVHVLQPQSEPSLTLVTCYPFYYAGNAPQRFIVHATLQGTKPVEPETAGR
jgi:sortase A